MNIKPSSHIIIALLFVYGFGMKFQLKPISYNVYRKLNMGGSAPGISLKKIIIAYHIKERPNKLKSSEDLEVAYSYNMNPSRANTSSNEEIEFEQWKYFIDNYLKKKFKDYETGEEYIWMDKYADDVLQIYVNKIYGGKLDLNVFEDKGNDPNYGIIRQFCNLTQRKLKIINANFRTEYKRVGILLKLEGIYKNVIVSFSNSISLEANLDVFSHADMINKYTGGNDQRIITIYCNLFHQAFGFYDDLCLEFHKGPKLSISSIKRIYYTLNLEHVLLAGIISKLNSDDVDYLEILRECRYRRNASFQKTIKKSLIDVVLTNNETIIMLNHLSITRFEKHKHNSFPKVILGHHFLKHEETFVFSKEEREGTETMVREQAKFLMKHFEIHKTFKVIILRNSLIDRTIFKLIKFMIKSIKLMNEFINYWRIKQGVDLRDGFDSFFLEDCGTVSLERWNYIKENFMKKSYASKDQTYYNILESTVIYDIATIYSHLEKKDLKQFYEALSHYKSEFIDDVLLKLYLYVFVKFSYTPDRVNVELIIKYHPSFNILIRFIEFDFAYKNLDNPKIWIKYIEANKNEFPVYIQKNYKKFDWIKDNLTFNFDKPEFVMTEKSFLKILKTPKASRYNNKIFLKSVFESVLKVDSSKLDYPNRDGMLKICKYLFDKYKTMFSEDPNVEINEAILKSDLYGIRLRVPSWFQNSVDDESNELSMESVPAFFFREFQIYERNLEEPTT